LSVMWRRYRAASSSRSTINWRRITSPVPAAAAVAVLW